MFLLDLIYFTLPLKLKVMVCASCWLRCPFKSLWHTRLDVTHMKLTQAYRKLENLQIHLGSIPILRRDRSYTSFKIKNLKIVIKRKEKIVDQINEVLDLDDCADCAACIN